MWMYVGYVVGSIAFVWLLVNYGLGLVIINETEVGTIINKFGKDLPNGQIIAMNGEAGFQADTLAPGWHLWYWSFKYEIQKHQVVIIENGNIGLVVARDGKQIPQGFTSAKIVECNNFQDAKLFLENGGEKGRQLGLLTSGVYRINLALFEVITVESEQNIISKDLLKVINVPSGKIGLVTVLEGKTLEEGKVAGLKVEGHKAFQDPNTFLNNGGQKGLQTEVLNSGIYTINPWFAQVDIDKMTDIPLGFVGVVVSSSGESEEDVSGAEFKHTNIVKRGNRGIWLDPLLPGKHPINTKVNTIELVPTTNLVLNWGNETSNHNYDSNLNSVKARTKDGFEISLDISQIIHISSTEASKVISRFGSVQNLVDNILHPIIGNYFRNSCQNADALSYVSQRAENQKQAAAFIKDALDTYNVQGVDTLIGDLIPPAELMKTLTDRKVADEQKETFAKQKDAQDQKRKLIEATALAEAQTEVIKEQQLVHVSESKAKQNIEDAKGAAEKIKLEAQANAEATKIKAAAEAESIEKVGAARAKAYTATAEALGAENLTSLEIISKLADNKIKITPDVYAGGSESGGQAGLLVASILGQMHDRKKLPEKSPDTPLKK